MTLRFTPDAYSRAPELWLANQGGHMALGAGVAIAICAGWLMLAGSFPYRSAVFAALVLAYLGRVELVGQGWRGWDTVEDTLFVVIYGAGPILFAFREINPGTGAFKGNVFDVLPFLGAAGIHLAAGAAWRVRNRRRAGHGVK